MVDTMLKEFETATEVERRRGHRTYSKHFKAELVTACRAPGASIAGIASTHGMNANVLHRWLREHQLTGCHRVDGNEKVALELPPEGTQAKPPEFIPVRLPSAAGAKPAAEVSTSIKVEIRHGALQMNIAWPMSGASEFAQWASGLLR